MTIKLTGTVTPKSETATYPSHIDNYGKGGIHSVDTIITRDNISTERRSVGMLCYVEEDKILYALVDGIDNINWQKFYDFNNTPFPAYELINKYILLGNIDNLPEADLALYDLWLLVRDLRVQHAKLADKLNLKRRHLITGDDDGEYSTTLNLDVENMPVLGSAEFPDTTIEGASPVLFPNPLYTTAFDPLQTGYWLQNVLMGSDNLTNTAPNTIISHAIGALQILVAQLLKRIENASFIVKNKDITWTWENPDTSIIDPALAEIYNYQNYYSFGDDVQALDDLDDGLIFIESGNILTGVPTINIDDDIEISHIIGNGYIRYKATDLYNVALKLKKRLIIDCSNDHYVNYQEIAFDEASKESTFSLINDNEGIARSLSYSLLSNRIVADVQEVSGEYSEKRGFDLIGNFIYDVDEVVPSSIALRKINYRDDALVNHSADDIEEIFNYSVVNDSFSLNKLLQLASGATYPLNPVAGAIWYNTNTNTLDYYNGTSWVQPTVGVSSIAVTGQNGIDVTGSPITSSGTIDLSLSNVPAGVIQNYPNDSSLYLNGSGAWTAPTSQRSIVQADIATTYSSALANDHFRFDRIVTYIGNNIDFDNTTAYTNTLGVASIGRFRLRHGYAYKMLCHVHHTTLSGSVKNVITFNRSATSGNVAIGTGVRVYRNNYVSATFVTGKICHAIVDYTSIQDGQFSTDWFEVQHQQAINRVFTLTNSSGVNCSVFCVIEQV